MTGGCGNMTEFNQSELDRQREDAVTGDSLDCPNPKCHAHFDERCIAKMTQEQLETYEGGFCPYCEQRLL